jgi:hypothetical protein
MVFGTELTEAPEKTYDLQGKLCTQILVQDDRLLLALQTPEYLVITKENDKVKSYPLYEVPITEL